MSPTSKEPPSDMSAADSFNQICKVRIHLLDTDPIIRREVEVPTSITLKVLHDIIQITMGWLDYHLWQFTIGGQTCGLPTEEGWGVAPRLQAIKVRLRDVLAPPTTIDYMYDFSDSWAHRLTVSGIRQGEPVLSYPRYIGGAWSAPPHPLTRRPAGRGRNAHREMPGGPATTHAPTNRHDQTLTHIQ
jgi:hypothetical protein